MRHEDLIEMLRRQAVEIAADGHARWGNTMLAAADALEASSAQQGGSTAERQAEYLPACPPCYGVWFDTKNYPPPLGAWCVGRKGTHRPFTFRSMEEGRILKGTAYLDADNAYRDPDQWQAIAP